MSSMPCSIPTITSGTSPGTPGRFALPDMALLILAGLWFLRRALTDYPLHRQPGLAIRKAVTQSTALLPAGLVILGLLLSTAALAMINVNFWRYWATADGWLVLGRYPFTTTDPLHVTEGGVSKYFVSYPLLPLLLGLAYQIVGHNTLASYLPIILANALLPLIAYLTAKEATGRPRLSFLVSMVITSFPLLRRYTMDVGEADGLLMTTVLLAAYLRARSNRSDSRTGTHVGAGFAAGIAALSRPEGVLYVAAMYVASAMARWRHRGLWASSAVLAAILAAFSWVSATQLGSLWPGNHSSTLRIDNPGRTWSVALDSGIYWRYASALGVSGEALAGMTAGLLLVVLVATVLMARSRFELLYMPVAALGNVTMVFFVGPIPAEAAKFHDFFRHMSYGFPLLAVTVAYALGYALDRSKPYTRLAASIFAYGGLAVLAFAQLSLLEGPVLPLRPAQTPLMTSDVHVTLAQVVEDPMNLPVMRFREDDRRLIPDSEDFMSVYPDVVYKHYEPNDVRRSGNSIEYYSTVKTIFAGYLVLMLVGAVALERPDPRTPLPTYATPR